LPGRTLIISTVIMLTALPADASGLSLYEIAMIFPSLRSIIPL